MARARRTKAESGGGDASGFTCPECGRTFATAAALGSHRRRAHGIAGTSRTLAAGGAARRSRRLPGSASARSAGVTSTVGEGGGGSEVSSTATSSRSAGRGATAPRRRRASPRRDSRQPASVNRDALLQSLFPGGIPPREEVIRAVNAWLDEAERLARLA
jgi:hypothetical protein